MQPALDARRGIRLADAFPEGTVLGGDVRFSSCTSDSRACQPGDLYVAVLGAEHDGHDFAADAVRRGAVAVLAEQPLALGVPVCVVRDTRVALGAVSQALAGYPARRLDAIGVTGTNGKTSTCLLLASILRQAGQVAGLTTSLSNGDGLEATPAHRTTPSQVELAGWLARMAANHCSHAVIEVSSHALAQRQLAGIELAAAVLTNVRRDHLELHGSLPNYRQIKARLFSQLRPDAFVVVNADDPTSQELLSKLAHPVLTFGMRNPAELTARVIERLASEQTFLLSAGNETVPVRTSIIGDQHVQNCLAAASVGLVLGHDLTTVARGLERVERIPGRMERLECGQPFSVFVDAARNSDQLAANLRAARQVAHGRVICVCGADSNQDRDHRPLMGRAIERGAEIGVVTSEPLDGQSPLELTHQVLDGYDRPGKARVIPSRKRAIVWALEQARPGDAVLITGPSREWTGHQDQEHTDREVAKGWLHQVGAKRSYETRPRPVIGTFCPSVN